MDYINITNSNVCMSDHTQGIVFKSVVLAKSESEHNCLDCEVNPCEDPREGPLGIPSELDTMPVRATNYCDGSLLFLDLL